MFFCFFVFFKNKKKDENENENENEKNGILEDLPAIAENAISVCVA